MKRSYLLCLTALWMSLIAIGTAHALPYYFSGSDNGGTASAIMEFSTTGNTLTVTIRNTSPVNLDGETTGGNTPGIVGFGFDLDPDGLILQSWTLTADSYSGENFTPTSIGPGAWIMDDFIAGIALEYIPQSGTGISTGALFNPDAVTDNSNELTGNPYFTLATLVMNFQVGSSPALNDLDEWSPFVRMQNVGRDGDGSLKLPGTPIPEPATMLLLGSGLIGLAGLGRKKFRKS